jgi:hypothetical protein
VPLEELPVLSEEEARAVIVEAQCLLRAAGAREKEKEAPRRGLSSAKLTHKPNGSGGDFFARVNVAALANIEGWARTLFPRARFQPGTSAWRVSSEDLGRDLEEDISIHPEGIWDFGEEVPLAAVDLVMRYAGVGTAIDAALWLCRNLGITPKCSVT